MHYGSDAYWEERGLSDATRGQRWFLALLAASRALIEAGRFDEAIEALKALSWGDETYENGDYAFDLALCYEAKGDFPQALRYFEIALRENPPVPGRAGAVERLKALVPELDRLPITP
ncbi:MAG: tetratricopeptide repeat protein [Methylobacterium sp.]|nr:tetratricopeptide repeat protein [Methylobacterium sp.]MCE2932042.1 tetratricopeptide repeat protein [Hyphomicrobiales bacterium]MCA3642429.1 tetratricopeptide repeat protein [Methylobacterium sp.]MCA3655200.1 tetratricopeptide repeat protein [Methylobacterium sp.]MCA3658896.1 tetratricopeptide repeat protein [Methylobacterium sp.]